MFPSVDRSKFGQLAALSNSLSSSLSTSHVLGSEGASALLPQGGMDGSEVERNELGQSVRLHRHLEKSLELQLGMRRASSEDM